MARTKVQELPEKEKPNLIRLYDRCDLCGAQAFIRMTKLKDAEQLDDVKVLELLWCGHHGRKFSVEMLANGWEIEDHTHLLDQSSVGKSTGHAV